MAINSPQGQLANKAEDVPSLLIPVDGCLLILPTVTVAEMVSYTHATPVNEAPDWYLGDIVWREQKVPLLSFEVLNGEARPAIHPRCRIAVLNNTGVSQELPFLALPTQGIPRLARVNAEEVSEAEGVQKKPFEFMHIQVAGEEAVIPDVAALEQAYLDCRRQSS